jgi:hypothetical protein
MDKKIKDALGYIKKQKENISKRHKERCKGVEGTWDTEGHVIKNELEARYKELSIIEKKLTGKD